MYYLDNAATTAPHPKVLEEINRLNAACFGNPSSVHPAGQEAEKVLSDSRKTLARLFNVPLAGIVFCGSGTESDNLALKGFFRPGNKTTPQIVISPLEHAAITKTCDWLVREGLATVQIVNIDKATGMVDLEHLAGIMTQNTSLVSIQHVNSEIGTIQDLAAISNVIRSLNPKVVFHSDGVQAFTRIPVNLEDLGVDLYSISSHKFHGVKGAGALIMTKNLTLEPLIHGGGQEHGLRSGTENIVGVAAMALAAEIAVSEVELNNGNISKFTAAFKESIKQAFPDSDIAVPPQSIPHIISVGFPGILGEVLLHHLAKQGIFVSTGSACNATSKKLSPVLLALGFSPQRIKETIRISIAASEIPDKREEFFERFNSAVLELKNLLA